MSRRMLRYAVPVDDQSHLLELSGDPVSVAAAVNGATGEHYVQMWAEGALSDRTLEPEGDLVLRQFRVFGTGHSLPDGAVWRGTCPRTADGLVWHLYELTGG